MSHSFGEREDGSNVIMQQADESNIATSQMFRRSTLYPFCTLPLKETFRMHPLKPLGKDAFPPSDNVPLAAAWCVYNEKRYFAAAAIYQLLWVGCPRSERNTQLLSMVVRPGCEARPHQLTNYCKYKYKYKYKYNKKYKYV